MKAKWNKTINMTKNRKKTKVKTDYIKMKAN